MTTATHTRPMTIARPAASSNRHPRCGKGVRTLGAHRRWRTANRAGALETVEWAKMTPEEREEEAMDMVIRLATTINAYEEVAMTSKSTNMGTYVYEKLDAIPEEFRPRLLDELSDAGLVNCWYIAGLLYKVKLQEREAGGALDISSDLEDYQERLDMTVEKAAERGTDSFDESIDDDEYDFADDEEGRAAKARRRAALVASAAGVQVFEGRAANVPGGPFINRFQKVFYPSPKEAGVWHGRVVLKKPNIVEKYLPLYFRTNDTVERFVKVGTTAEDADLLLDYQNPPYLESDMPPAMRYPSRRTPGGEGRGGTWWPVPRLSPPPFDTLVDYLRPLGPGVYAGRGWRDGGRGDEFLTFILFRRYDASPVEAEP